METENRPFFRFPAEKISIQELEEGEYIEEKEQNPNYILVNETKKIFRINVIAALIHKELRGSVTSILIDDGSGKIILRLFEEHRAAFYLEVGDVVQIVGKIRIFNQEKYIFPEIIKKINPAWLKVRFLELQKNKKLGEKEEKTVQKIEPKKNEKEMISTPKITQTAETFEVINEEIEENDPLLPFEKLSKLITELDKGEGAMIEEIIEKSPLEKTEEIIEKMLENGDIFQNMPGKVRLL
ncbi:MAG: hypothetical protein Q8R47_00175 [Nanoarchaeota archaeon]|nr:hypothetical protein [Nanoarchaeota archaeon]